MNEQEQHYLRTLKEDPHNEGALSSLEEFYFIEGEWQKLFRLYEKLIEGVEKNENKSDLYFKMGKIQHERLNNLKEAMVYYEKSCLLNSKNMVSLENLLNLLFDKKDFIKALQICELLEPQIKNDPVKHFQVLLKSFYLNHKILKSADLSSQILLTIMDKYPGKTETIDLIRSSDFSNKLWNTFVENLGDLEKVAEDDRRKQAFSFLKALIYLEKIEREQEGSNILKSLSRSKGPFQGESLYLLSRFYKKENNLSEYLKSLKKSETLTKNKERKIIILEEMISCLSEESRNDYITAYEKIFKLKNDHFSAYKVLLEYYRKEKRWTSLLDLVAKFINTTKDQKEKVKGFLIMGDIFRDHLKSPEKSVRCFKRVLQSDPKNAKGLISLSTLYELTEKDRDALLINEELKSLSESGNLEVQRFLKLKNIRDHYKKEKNIDDYISSLKDLVFENLDFEEGLIQLEQTCIEHEKWDVLLEVLEKFSENTENEKEKIKILEKISKIRLDELKDDSGSVVALRRILEIDHGHSLALNGLEKVYRKRENWGDLLHLLTRKREQSDRDQAIFQLSREIANIWEKKFKKPDHAYREYLWAHEKDSKHRENIRDLQRLSRVLSRHEETIEFYKAEAAILPDSEVDSLIRCHKEAVSLLRESFSGEVSRQIPHLLKLVELDPTDFDSLENLENIYEKEEKWTDLSKVLIKKIENISSPENKVPILIRLATVLENKLEDFENAINIWDSARKLKPSSLEPLWALYRLYHQKDRKKEWAEIGQDLLRLLVDENNLQSWRKISEELALYFEHHQEDFESSLEIWEKIYQYEEKNNLSTDASLEALGRLTKKSKKWLQRIIVLERQLERSSDDSVKQDLLNQIGMIYEEIIGDVEKGMQFYLKSLHVNIIQPENYQKVFNFLYSEEKWKDLQEIIQRKINDGQGSPSEKQKLMLDLAEINGNKLGNMQDAIRICLDTLNQDSENENALGYLIRFAEKNKDSKHHLLGLKKLFEISEKKGDDEGSADLLRKIISVYGEQYEEGEGAYFANKLLNYKPRDELAFSFLEKKMIQEKNWQEYEKVLCQKRSAFSGTKEEKNILLKLAENSEINQRNQSSSKNYYQSILSLDNMVPDSSDLGWLGNLVSYNQSEKNWTKYCENGELYLSLWLKEKGKSKELCLFCIEIANIYKNELNKTEEAIDKFTVAADIVFSIENICIDDVLKEKLFFPLFECLKASDKYGQMVQILTAYVEKLDDKREKSEKLNEIGDLYQSKLMDIDKATQFYEQSLKIFPTDKHAFDILVNIYDRDQSWENLVQVYERRAEHLLDFSEVALLQEKAGNIWEDHLNDKVEASLCYQKALELAPKGSKEFRFITRLYKIYKEQKNWAGLIKTIEILVEQEKNSEKKVSYLLELANLYEDESEEADKAYQEYLNVLEIDSANKTALQSLIRLSLEKNDYDDAQRMIQEFISTLEDDDVRIRNIFRLAELRYEKLSDIEGAVAAYEDIIAINPRNIEALRQLNRFYLELENWEKLIRVYKNISTLVPSNEEKITVLKHLSDIYYHKLDQTEKALKVYIEILEIEPVDRQAYEQVEKILSAQEKWPELVQTHEVFLRHVSRSEEGYATAEKIAKIYDDHLQQIEKSIPFYIQLAEGKENIDAINRLCEIFKSREQWSDLERFLRLKIDSNISHKEIFQSSLLLSDLLINKLNLEEEGLEILENVFQKAKDSDDDGAKEIYRESLFFLVDRYEKKNRNDRLLELLPERIVHTESTKDKIEYLNLLGNLREEESNDLKGSKKAYLQSVDLSWQQEEFSAAKTALEGLVRILPQLEDWQNLRMTYEKMIQSFENPTPWRLALGKLLLDKFPDQESVQVALDNLEEVLTEQPLDLMARSTLNQALETLEMWKRWVDSVGAEISLETDQIRKAELHEKLAEVFEKKFNDLEGSQKSLEAVLEILPDRHHVRHHLVSIYLEKNEINLAIQTLLNAMDTHEKSYDLQTLLAEAARISLFHDENTDKHEEAKKYLKKSLLLATEDEPHYQTCNLWFQLEFLEKRTLEDENDDEKDLGKLYKNYFQKFEKNADAEFFYRWAFTLGESDIYQDEKISLYQKCLALNPNHEEASLGLGRYYFREEQYENAFTAWRRFYEEEKIINCHQSEFLNQLATCAFEVHEFEGFVRLIEQMIETENIQPHFVFCFLKLHDEESIWKKSRIIFSSIMENNNISKDYEEPTLAYFSFVYASLLKEESIDENDQIRWFRFSSEHCGSFAVLQANALFELGLLFVEMEQKRQASKVFNEILDLGRQVLDNVDHEKTLMKILNEKGLEVILSLPKAIQPKWPDMVALEGQIANLLEGIDDRKSADHYENFLRENPTDRGIIQKLSTWYEEWDENEKLVNLYVFALANQAKVSSKESKDSEQLNWRIETLRKLAALYLKENKDPEKACEVFEELRDLSPEDEETHFALAALYDAGKSRHLEAIHEHEWLIERDPLRIASYKAIFGHYLALGKNQRAGCIASILVLLGEAEDEEKKMADLLEHQEPEWKPGTISMDARKLYLLHSLEKEYLYDLFQAIRNGLEKVFTFDLEKYQISSENLVRSNSPPAVYGILKKANKIFRAFGGKDLRVYWDRQSQNRFILENDKIPALIISSDFFPLLDEKEQNFLVGRVIQFALDGFTVLSKVKSRSIENILNSLLQMIDPETNLVLTEEELEETTRTKTKMGRKAKKIIRPLLEKHADRDRCISPRDWLKSLQATANRGGLLSCGSLKVATSFLTVEAGLENIDDPKVYIQQIRDKKPLRDLIVYAASSNYFSLRELLFEELN